MSHSIRGYKRTLDLRIITKDLGYTGYKETLDRMVIMRETLLVRLGHIRSDILNQSNVTLMKSFKSTYLSYSKIEYGKPPRPPIRPKIAMCFLFLSRVNIKHTFLVAVGLS